MKFYVIGLGSIGLRHAKNLLAMGHEVFGFDADKEKLERAISAGIIRPKHEYPELPVVDSWVIATPTVAHAAWLLHAVSKNIPVFVEKPIAHHEDLNEIAGVLHHKKTLVAVGNNLRFHPSVQALKKDLVENKFGAPHWALLTCGQFNDRPQYLRDGVTLNWGAHEIDLALHLFGPARVEGAAIDKDDVISDILLVHDQWYGTRSVVHLDYLTQLEMRTTMVLGPKGDAAIDLPQRTYIGSFADKPFHFVGTGSYDLDYANEMRAFADAVEGKKPWPGATASEALDVLKIIDIAKQF